MSSELKSAQDVANAETIATILMLLAAALQTVLLVRVHPLAQILEMAQKAEHGDSVSKDNYIITFCKRVASADLGSQKKPELI